MGFFRNILEELGIFTKSRLVDSLSSVELTKLSEYAKNEMAKMLIQMLSNYSQISEINTIIELGSFSTDSNKYSDIEKKLGDYQFNLLE